MIDLVERGFTNATPFGPKQECHGPVWDDAQSKFVQGDRVIGKVERDQLKAGVAQTRKARWPGGDLSKRNAERSAHRYADRLAVERVARLGAHQHCARAKRHGVAKDPAHIFGVAKALDHNDQGRFFCGLRDQNFEAKRLSNLPYRETAAVHVEAHDIAKDFLLGDVDRRVAAAFFDQRLERLERLRVQKEGVWGISRIAQQHVNHEAAFRHKKASLAAKVRIPHVPVIRKARVAHIIYPNWLHEQSEAQQTKPSPPGPNFEKLPAKPIELGHIAAADF